MLIGFKTELKVNNKQRTLLAKHAGTARHAWNQGLALTQLILDVNRLAKETNQPELRVKFPSAIDLHKWLVAEVKKDHPWYYEVSKCAGQWALRQLRTAWDRCFKKVAKTPRFKKKGRNDSFTLDGIIKIKGSNHIQVPVIGVLKTYRPLEKIFCAII